MNAALGKNSISVLIGPSYLDEIERIRWSGAVTRYLKKFKRSADRADLHIHYDLDTIRARVAGQPVSGALADIILQLNADTN